MVTWLQYNFKLILIKELDRIYHAAIRFVTNTSSCSHHCALYKMVGWSSLYQRRQIHTLPFTAKALLGKLPTCNLLSYYTCNYSARNSYELHLTVPRVCSEFSLSSDGPRLWDEMLDDIFILYYFYCVSNLHVKLSVQPFFLARTPW